MIFHFHKTKVSVNLFIVLKISLASHVTLLVIVIITCIHERKSPFARAAGSGTPECPYLGLAYFVRRAAWLLWT